VEVNFPAKTLSCERAGSFVEVNFPAKQGDFMDAKQSSV